MENKTYEFYLENWTRLYSEGTIPSNCVPMTKEQWEQRMVLNKKKQYE